MRHLTDSQVRAAGEKKLMNSDKPGILWMFNRELLKDEKKVKNSSECFSNLMG